MKKRSPSQGSRCLPHFLLCILFAALITGLPISHAAAQLVIDHCETNQTSATVNISAGDVCPGGSSCGPVVTLGSGLAGVQGGYRLMSAAVVNGLGPKTGAAQTEIVPLESRCGFSSALSTTGQGRMVYSGNADPDVHNLNLDLAHYTRFTVAIISCEHFPFTLRLGVVPQGGTTAQRVTVAKTVTATGLVVFDFSEFAGFNFSTTKVGSIEQAWYNMIAENEWSWHFLQAECVADNPSVDSLTANPPSLTGPGNVTISWVINLKPVPGPENPLDATITSNCGVGPYTVTTASGDHLFNNVTPGCVFTLVEHGFCADASRQVTIQQTPNRVPSLNEWGMIILSLLLAASAVWMLRRRKTN